MAEYPFIAVGFSLDARRQGCYSARPKSGIVDPLFSHLTAHRMPFDRRQIVLLLAVLALAGCNTPIHRGKSPLAPAQMSADSIVLEMFFVRVPFGDPSVNEKLWGEIDEQQFSPELRERLARNGFRAGLISGQMPAELSKLLELGDKPAPDGAIESTKVEDLESQPRVVRRHQQIRPGQRSEIIASGVYGQLPVFTSESGHLLGQTYNQAQGFFAVKAFPQPDGHVRIEMVPELHHGESRQRWVPGQGMMRLEAGQPKRAFDDMTLSADLVPGAMIVVSSLSNRPGSLGHHFFTEATSDDRMEQKLLVVRLAHTQNDGLFNPPEPIKLEE